MQTNEWGYAYADDTDTVDPAVATEAHAASASGKGMATFTTKALRNDARNARAAEDTAAGLPVRRYLAWVNELNALTVWDGTAWRYVSAVREVQVVDRNFYPFGGGLTLTPGAFTYDGGAPDAFAAFTVTAAPIGSIVTVSSFYHIQCSSAVEMYMALRTSGVTRMSHDPAQQNIWLQGYTEGLVPDIQHFVTTTGHSTYQYAWRVKAGGPTPIVRSVTGTLTVINAVSPA